MLKWIEHQLEGAAFISAITLGEIRHGALLLDDGRKKRALLRWIDETLKPQFIGRILSADAEVMERWAVLQAACQRAGNRLPLADSILAATALVHDLTIVTRNTADFLHTGVVVLNPWGQ